MKRIIAILIIGIFCLSSCTGQEVEKDLLVLSEATIVFFKPDEEEYRSLVQQNPNYSELEVDYSSGISPFINQLDSMNFKYIITSKKEITFKYKNVVHTINVREGKNIYGVMFFNGSTCPFISYGPYPAGYYAEKFEEIL